MTPHDSPFTNETGDHDLSAQQDAFVDAHLPGNDRNDEDQPRNDDALAPVVPRHDAPIGRAGVGPC
jgi:hypothetical protein